jgi:hypothetical protein
MRQAARAEFEGKFTADANYKLLMAAYHRVLGRENSETFDSAVCEADNGDVDSTSRVKFLTSSSR